ncbi:MAG: energy-coupling factor ABC transporter permease [Desulfohalobium sp.]
MGAAIIFFISLLPIPAFTGTCSHPCGTPLVAILLGPVIGFALTGAVLLLQAAFFAHGGFGTWGANVVALGFFGSLFGWGAFRLARMFGFPIWAAGMAGGLTGNIMVYASSGFILGIALFGAPEPRYSFEGYLLVIYTAYLPTQLPISVGEMFLTGLALHYANKQRPDVLGDLGVTDRRNDSGFRARLSVLLILLLFLGLGKEAGVVWCRERPLNAMASVHNGYASSQAPRFSGLDEAVNEQLAEEARLKVREPYIDTESWQDLWNLLLLVGGGVCGFVIGRWWHILWGRRKS